MTLQESDQCIKTWEDLESFCRASGLTGKALEDLLENIDLLKDAVRRKIETCTCSEVPAEEPRRIVNWYKNIPARAGVKVAVVDFVRRVLQDSIENRDSNAVFIRGLIDEYRRLGLPVAESGYITEMVMEKVAKLRKDSIGRITEVEIVELFSKFHFPTERMHSGVVTVSCDTINRMLAN